MTDRSDDLATLDVVSLFSGVGGIDLAFERAGCTTRLLCEQDKHAAKVLARHFPDAPIHHDVKELTADDLRDAGARPGRTVVLAGFPCQDLSVAGRRRGLREGTRSGLFFEIIRILRDFPARWVLLENVPGLLSQDGGRAMGAVLGSLAELGYGFAFRVLDAQHFGVPQRRRRVVIVGRLGDSGAAPAQVLLEPEGCGGDLAPSRASGARTAGRSARGADDVGIVNSLTAAQGGPDDNVAQAGHLIAQPLAIRGRDDGAEVEMAAPGSPSNALRTPGGGSSHAMVCVTGTRSHALTAEGADASEDGTGRRTPIVAATLAGARPMAFHMTQDPISSDRTVPAMGAKAGGNGIATDSTVRRLTPLECERLQGHPDGWTEGQSDAQRYKQMGNGVAVPVFEWVARRLVAIEMESA